MSEHERGPEIDVDELTRRAFFPVDEADLATKERVRARLHMAFSDAEGRPGKPPARRQRRRLIAVSAAVTALAVLALVLSLILPPGSGGPGLSGAQELRRLGEVARAQPSDRSLAPGELLYSKIEQSLPHGQTYIGEGSFTYIQRATVESWLAADGSGVRNTLVEAISFPSEEDRRAWEALGSPALPKPGDRTTEEFKPGTLGLYDLDSLPTDTDELAPLIHGQTIIEHGKGNDLVFYAIGELLAQGDASSEVRAALVEVAAELPDVRSLGTVTDPLGREGIGIEVTHSGGATRLIFDPDTSELFAEERIAPIGEGSTSVLQWQAFEQQSVVASGGSRTPA